MINLDFYKTGDETKQFWSDVLLKVLLRTLISLAEDFAHNLLPVQETASFRHNFPQGTSVEHDGVIKVRRIRANLGRKQVELSFILKPEIAHRI